jgi:methyltransferase (TIGR00027 family)
MKRDTQSATARGVAIARALEQAQPPARRLLDDPYAAEFAREGFGRFATSTPLFARALAALSGLVMPGSIEYVSVRARFSDDLLAACARAGARQFLVLGAGFDTAALRIGSAYPELQLYEVDHPATQAAKRAAVARIAPRADARIRFVPVDFERDDLVERLTSAGFRRDLPSLATWMGVSYYLTAPAVAATLDRLAELLAPGSTLTFDYVIPSAIDGTSPNRSARIGTRRAARAGEPFIYALEPADVGPLLERHGFELVDQATPDELVPRYTAVHRKTIDFAYLVTARRR